MSRSVERTPEDLQAAVARGPDRYKPSPVGDLFNSGLAAFAVIAADELGVWEQLQEHSGLSISAFARAPGLDERALRSTLVVLAAFDLVAFSEPDLVVATEATPSLLANKGFFTWMFGGNGELLRSSATFTKTSEQHRAASSRDARAVSLGCADFGGLMIDPVLDTAIDSRAYSRVADLGCGGAQRLIRVLQAQPHLTGVGIDIAPPAVELANERLRQNGLSHRAAAKLGNVHSLQPDADYTEVDLLLCFLMGHDFWPHDKALQVLNRLRRNFPSLRTLVLCDTYLSESLPDRRAPILTLGFEHVHALMGHYLPTHQQWLALFDEAGWRLVREHEPLGMPYTTMFELAP